MTYDCDCCEGISPLTPRAIVNRPSLGALAYRVGTHHSFLQTMLARLSSQQFSALANLKTRETDDFAIALLDSWATVADVLTFYQERIANEGYLRTATERRSVLELARLVDYQLRPGVSASVYLAFSLEKDFNDDKVFIPAGTQAQSIPGPDELPQTFETEKDEPARTVWNYLQPRLTRPQFIDQTNAPAVPIIYAEGILTDLKANDRLIFVFNNDSPTVRSVRAVETQPTDQRTKITLLETTPPVRQPLATESPDDLPKSLASIRAISQKQLEALSKPPTLPPINALRLTRSEAQAFNPATDLAPNLLTKLQPTIKDSFYAAWENTPVTAPATLSSAEVLKVKAAPFGHTAAPKTIYDSEGRPVGTEEWGLEPVKFGVEIFLREEQSLSIRVFMVDRGRLFNGRATADQETGEIPLITLGNDVRVRVVVPTPVITAAIAATAADPIRFDFEDSTGQLLKRFRILSPGTADVTDDVILLRAFVRRAAPLAMAVAETSFSVQVDSDTPQSIRFGQQFSYTVETRQVFVDFGRARLLMQDAGEGAVQPARRNMLALDTQYDKILPGSWVVLEQPRRDARPFRIVEVQTVSLNRYGLTGKVTQLVLSANWLTQNDIYLSDIQDVTVYAQSEPLTLAEEVIDPVAEPVQGDEIELGELYDGLQAGRWLIVTGERTDIPNATRVWGTELTMLAAVRQGVGVVSGAREVPTVSPERPNTSTVKDPPPTAIPGDKTHSFLQLEKPLEYAYKRDTVTVYGNVVKGTHGETRQEVLGSGDSGQSFQQFTLRQPPLTFVSAPTPSGVDSTLEVLVNQVQWHEVESLGRLEQSDRAFITRNDNDGNTQITFGDGYRGLRLPTGIENVRAKYRSGIGKGGNVKAEQISLLASRPLGVKNVINPLAATGGADPESRDQARRNAPLAVMALDRLVSVQDYEDFTRTFAGIGKASVAQLSDGRRQVIHLTIAGEADIPIAPTSDLYRNLLLALRTYGSPNRWVQVAVRDLMLLLIAVKVRILPDYRWEFVAPAIRTALLDTFSFERRALGQAVRSSEVIAAIHRVPGVDYVDLDVLESIAESEVIGAPEPDPPPEENPTSRSDLGRAKPSWLDKLEAIANPTVPGPKPVVPVNLAQIDPDSGTLLPAQLAILSPDIRDTLKIEELAP